MGLSLVKQLTLSREIATSTVATSPLSSHSRSARQSSVAATPFYSLHLPQAALVNVPRNDTVKRRAAKAMSVANPVESCNTFIFQS